MRNGTGFTIVELIMTMMLIGILSMVAIPFFADVPSAKVDSAAKKLVSDLSYTRQLARNRNEIYGISFNVDADQYTVHLYNPSTNTETTVTDPMTRTPMVIDLTQMPGLSGVDIQAAGFGGSSKVRFSPHGVPAKGSGTILATAGTVVLEEGGVTRTVAVQPSTGEVSK